MKITLVKHREQIIKWEYTTNIPAVFYNVSSISSTNTYQKSDISSARHIFCIGSQIYFI